MEGKFLEELRLYIQRNQDQPLRASVQENSCFFRLGDGAYMQRAEVKPPEQTVDEHVFQQFRKRNKPAVLPVRRTSERILPSEKAEEDLEEYIRRTRNEETFSTKLLKYIDSTGLSDADIYKKAGIDRRHFSKIRCDRNYRPKKSTVIALCLALELKLEQAEELLGLAGYYLSRSDTSDLIVRFCIENGKHDLADVNEALVYFGMKTIGVTE